MIKVSFLEVEMVFEKRRNGRRSHNLSLGNSCRSCGRGVGSRGFSGGLKELVGCVEKNMDPRKTLYSTQFQLQFFLKRKQSRESRRKK